MAQTGNGSFDENEEDGLGSSDSTAPVPGDRPADALLPEIYGELKGIARHYLGGDRGAQGLTIQPTILVHEAYIRLSGRGAVDDSSKTHFFALAATAVRHALRDHLRGRGRLKRGGGFDRITLSGLEATPDEPTVDLLALDQALEQFRELDSRAAQVVDLRYFAGLTEVEIAEVLEVSERTVRNDWTVARAWLLSKMKDETNSA
ncbi:MAG: ECF-type sigma factor [Planctomycetota bacterium]